MFVSRSLVLGCPFVLKGASPLSFLRPQRRRVSHPARLRDRDGFCAPGGRMAPQYLAALRPVATVARDGCVERVRGRQAARPRGRAQMLDPGQQVLGRRRRAGVGRLREADANGRASWSREATRASGLHGLLAIGIFVVACLAIPRFHDGMGRRNWGRSLQVGVTARSRSAADRHTKGPAQVLADEGGEVGRRLIGLDGAVPMGLLPPPGRKQDLLAGPGDDCGAVVEAERLLGVADRLAGVNLGGERPHAVAPVVPPDVGDGRDQVEELLVAPRGEQAGETGRGPREVGPVLRAPAQAHGPSTLIEKVPVVLTEMNPLDAQDGTARRSWGGL